MERHLLAVSGLVVWAAAVLVGVAIVAQQQPGGNIIEVKNLTKKYTTEGTETVALNGVSFKIQKGEFVAIMGPSGSGKSTLMHILGALDLPSGGDYILDGENVSKLSDDDLADIRNRKIGFVFQAFNLLRRTSALVNVTLPMKYGGVPKKEQTERAKKFLTMVGLGDRMDHTTSQLSGGQQQRVAIARSLTMNPSILLADEPTGNLASAQSLEIMEIFEKLHSEGRTILMITHESEIAHHAKRIITLKDGLISSDVKNGHLLGAKPKSKQ